MHARDTGKTAVWVATNDTVRFDGAIGAVAKYVGQKGSSRAWVFLAIGAGIMFVLALLGSMRVRRISSRSPSHQESSGHDPPHPIDAWRPTA
jgi:hypothetical protein